MKRDRESVLLALFGASLLFGCEAKVTPAARAPSPPPVKVVAPRERLEDGPLGEYASLRLGVRVPLPDGRRWRIDDHTTSFLSATHEPSRSALLLRVWREDSIVNRQRCEDKVRLLRELPLRGTAEIIERRAVSVPRDFDTVVEIGVIGSQQPGREKIDAFAMAFGGWAHRCFAYIFTTSAEGAGASEVVGERLGAMVQGSLEKLQFESDTEPKIDRQQGR